MIGSREDNDRALSKATQQCEIATAEDGTNSAYAVLVVGGVPTSYQINLDTGFAASLGAVTLLDDDELVHDTTIAPPASAPAQAPGDLLALTEGNRLLSFNRALPQKACTNAPSVTAESTQRPVITTSAPRSSAAAIGCAPR